MDVEQIIEQVLEAIFQSTKINNFQIEVNKSESDKKYNVAVEIEPASIFIGKGGEMLDVFESIIGAILRTHLQEHWFVEFDVNNYRTERNYTLKELAKKAAHRVLVLKTPVRMDSMNPRERRLIHSEIALYPDLISESEGYAPDRYVVIKYRQ